MIEDYSFGRIIIGGKTYTSDLVIYPDHINDAWWRRQGHNLCLDDLRDVLAARPEVLVVGTGAHGIMQVPAEVRQRVAELGIELKVAPTGEACALFNAAAAHKKAVAALHLTC